MSDEKQCVICQECDDDMVWLVEPEVHVCLLDYLWIIRLLRPDGREALKAYAVNPLQSAR